MDFLAVEVSGPPGVQQVSPFQNSAMVPAVCGRGRRGDSSPDFRSLVLRVQAFRRIGGPRDPTLSLTVCARDRESPR